MAPVLGVLYFVAVVLHKLPEGVTVASLMVAAGGGGAGSRWRWRGDAGHAAGRGTGPLCPGGAPRLGLGLAAGTALYVSASNLVPEMESRGRKTMVLTLLGGVAAFLILRVVIGAVQ